MFLLQALSTFYYSKYDCFCLVLLLTGLRIFFSKWSRCDYRTWSNRYYLRFTRRFFKPLLLFYLFVLLIPRCFEDRRKQGAQWRTFLSLFTRIKRQEFNSPSLLNRLVKFWSFTCFIIMSIFNSLPKQINPSCLCFQMKLALDLCKSSTWFSNLSKFPRIFIHFQDWPVIYFFCFLSELLGQAISNKLAYLINRDFLKVNESYFDILHAVC